MLFCLLTAFKSKSTSEGVHGAVAKATGWSAPTQGSNPGCGTFMLRGLLLEFSYKKKRGACCSILVLEAGGQEFFLPGHRDDGLVLELTVISMSFCVSDLFRLCADWHRSGKIQAVLPP